MTQTLSDQIKEQAKKTARIKTFMALPENQVYATVENKRLATLSLLKRFRDIRKSKGLTQKNIAQILNVKQPEVARFETGANSPTVDTLMSYLSAIGGKLEIIH